MGQRAAGDAERMREGQRVGIAYARRPQRGLVHQGADRVADIERGAVAGLSALAARMELGPRPTNSSDEPGKPPGARTARWFIIGGC